MLSPAEWSALAVSLQVAGGAVLLALPPAVALGWLFARRQFPGKSLAETAVFLPLVLPPVLTGYGILVLLGRQGPVGSLLRQAGIEIVFSAWGMALAGAVVSLPLMVRAVRLAVEGVDPGLEQAARTLGLSRWSTLRRVTYPLARAGLLAGVVLGFARALGEFGATVMVAPNVAGTRTLALEIYRQAAVPGGEPAILRLALISIVLSGLALYATERLSGRGRL